eukprot:3603148-Pleurochrysis_carterae.AAC.1
MVHCTRIPILAAPHLSAIRSYIPFSYPPLSPASSLLCVRSSVLLAILSPCLLSLTVVLSALCLIHQTDPPVEPGRPKEVPPGPRQLMLWRRAPLMKLATNRTMIVQS